MDVPQNKQILELSWQNMRPELFIGDSGVTLKTGESIDIVLSEHRYCVGYIRFKARERTPCQDKATIPSGKEGQCNFCKQQDASFTAKTGYGLSKQAGDLLSADHAVYLAYFADDIIKVGVALWERREVRVLEQGAIACLFIGRGNGTMARNLERKIHTQVGLTEWVRLETKLKNLQKLPTQIHIQLALEGIFDRIRSITPSQIMFDTPDFQYLLPSYSLRPEVAESDILLVQSVPESTRISGTIVGVMGSTLLITAADAHVYAVGGRYLSGFHCVDLSSTFKYQLAGLELKKIPANRQRSLFDI